MELIPEEVVMNKIFILRGQKVMLDKDLAKLYGLTTGNFNKAVNRNIKRFPKDFMFLLSKQEFDDLIFQFGTSSWGGTRKLPSAFTEQGVAMLSGVLNSDRAIAVHIQIIRVFAKMREMFMSNNEILLKMERQEKKIFSHDDKIKLIFKYLKQLINQKEKPLTQIGFKRKDQR